jgi:predicted methyltransferase
MKPVPDAEIQRAYRVRITLFLISAFLGIFFLVILYRGIATLNALDQVESERDRWQRPDDVIQALTLKDGNVVVDLGSGTGYFALKLSSVVGRRGSVVAVDILKGSLLFLCVRAFLRNQGNIRTIHGQPDNPLLQTGSADAVLIANTYHEFTQPKPILDHVFQSLKPGGRLVILDHALRSAATESREIRTEHHEISADLVDAEVRWAGFEIISHQDRFIDRPSDKHVWWLIVAQRRLVS